MSKLTIFLCAVLVASAVNASDVSDVLVTADALIGTIIYATTQKFDVIKSQAVEYVAKLEEAVHASKGNASLQVKSSLEEVHMAIDELALKEDGSEITDFNKLVSHFENTGFSAIANMSVCIDDRLATRRANVQNIITLSDNILANLTAIREEALHCGDNVDGIKTAPAAIECIDAAGLKAAWVETNTVPSLTIEMTKITDSFPPFELTLAHCEIIGGFETFFGESYAIFLKIDRMKHETRPGTGEATTEKAWSSETPVNSKAAST